MDRRCVRSTRAPTTESNGFGGWIPFDRVTDDGIERIERNGAEGSAHLRDVEEAVLPCAVCDGAAPFAAPAARERDAGEEEGEGAARSVLDDELERCVLQVRLNVEEVHCAGGVSEAHHSIDGPEHGAEGDEHPG